MSELSADEQASADRIAKHATVAIDNYIKEYACKTLAFLGIANLGVLLTALFYIFVLLPDKAYTTAETQYRTKWENQFAPQIEKLVAARVDVETARLKAIEAVDRIAEVDKILRDLGPNPDIKALSELVRLSKQPDQAGTLSETLRKIDAFTKKVDDARASQKLFLVAGTEKCPTGSNQLGLVGVIMRNQDYTNNVGGGSPFSNGWTWTHPILCRWS